MYPMNNIDISNYTLNQLVKPYWYKNNNNKEDYKEVISLGMKVYLSTNDEFIPDFLIDEFTTKTKQKDDDDDEQQQQQQVLPKKRFPKHDSILLWEEESISSPSLSKSFILTAAKNDDINNNNNNQQSPSFQYAMKYLDDADEKDALMKGDSTVGGGSDAMNALLSNAGDGIETTSVILSIYKGIVKTIAKVVGDGKKNSDNVDTENNNNHQQQHQQNGTNRVVVPIPTSSSVWSHLMTNSTTVNVHVILTRNTNNGATDDDNNNNNSNSYSSTLRHLQNLQSSYNMLVSKTKVVKHDLPNHISKPKRFLYKDALYILHKYILKTIQNDEPAPWQMEYTKPNDYKIYQSSLIQKEKKMGYPYFKPEMAVKLVTDDVSYPLDFVGASRMDVIRVNAKMRNVHSSGYAYLPGLYVDEMGLTSDKYIPLNETVDALPLRISFDSGLDQDSEGSSSGGLSPGRWRLLSFLSQSLEDQKELGFDQSDIDDVRRLIADTNVTLLGITVLASTLHLLFEFLTFKNDVEFWNGNKDLTGLSVRALFMDFISQTIILLFLIEEGSSLLMTVPAFAGCLIALWKCQKGAGFRFVKKTTKERSQKQSISLWNKFFRLFGYELHAMRLRAAAALRAEGAKKADSEKDLATLTEEMDCLATNTIGKYFLLPLVLGYTAHSLLNSEHSGWYSWFISSASAMVYAIGFVMMTPQLFLNYKLKSVAHLPWRVLGYRFVNTFIDDLFAMIIRMPTMARLSCFRDDIVFIIYLWQRYLYPVDTARPSEGGGMDAVSQASTTATIDDHKKKQKVKKTGKKKFE